MKLFLIFLAGMTLGGGVGVCAMCLLYEAQESDGDCLEMNDEEDEFE